MVEAAQDGSQDRGRHHALAEIARVREVAMYQPEVGGRDLRIEMALHMKVHIEGVEEHPVHEVGRVAADRALPLLPKDRGVLTERSDATEEEAQRRRAHRVGQRQRPVPAETGGDQRDPSLHEDEQGEPLPEGRLVTAVRWSVRRPSPDQIAEQPSTGGDGPEERVAGEGEQEIRHELPSGRPCKARKIGVRAVERRSAVTEMVPVLAGDRNGVPTQEGAARQADDTVRVLVREERAVRGLAHQERELLRGGAEHGQEQQVERIPTEPRDDREAGQDHQQGGDADRRLGGPEAVAHPVVAAGDHNRRSWQASGATLGVLVPGPLRLPGPRRRQRNSRLQHGVSRGAGEYIPARGSSRRVLDVLTLETCTK